MLNKSKPDENKKATVSLDDLFQSIEATKPEERKRDDAPSDKYAAISVQDKYTQDFFRSVIQTEEIRQLIPGASNLNDIYALVGLEYLMGDVDETKRNEMLGALSAQGPFANKLRSASSIYIAGVDPQSLSDSNIGIADARKANYIRTVGKMRLDSLRGYEVEETISKIAGRKSMFPKVAQAAIVAALIVYGIMQGYNAYKGIEGYQEKFIQHVTETYNINKGP